MYKVGDKIKLLVNYYTGCMPNGDGPKIGDILEVVEKNKCSTPGNWIDKYTAEVDGVNTYGNTEFSLLETVKPKFEIGDRVISVKNTPSIPEGFIGKVSGLDDSGVHFPIAVIADDGNYYVFKEDELELLSCGVATESKQVSPDIARPILEERKIGKVRMELFDCGFPNAIMEIARVMTWANQSKGYKDHDWKSLPDAENAFKGAAARHRVKLDAQRSFGEDLLNCVDEESSITHLAHECFNNLALLELALVGKIK